MSPRRAFLILTIFLALLPLAARADDAPTSRPTSGGGITRILDHLSDAVGSLNLTPDQHTRVNAILDTAREKSAAILQENQGLSFQERIQNVTPFLKDLHDKLAGILTPDQLKTVVQSVPALSGQGRGPMQRLRDALAQIDLSPDQHKQVDALLSDADQKIAAMRQSASGGEDVQDQMQDLRQDIRGKLMDILTPDQQKTFRDLMQQRNQKRDSGASGNSTTQNSAMPADSMIDGATPKSSDAPAKPSVTDSGPKPGQRAPDFHLRTLTNRPYELSSFSGHILVIEFGSLSCPVFRDNVKAIEKLHAALGSRAWIMLVYTRENFPAGDNADPRNVEDGISVSQPDTMDEKIALATQARDKLHITIPIAVDSLDDKVTSDFGAFPNGAVVIGLDGNIVARQKWANADSLRRAVEQAEKLPPGQFKVAPADPDQQ